MKRKAVNVVANDFARKNMWDSEYRPEQLFVRDYLASNNITLKIILEYPIRNLLLDGKPYRKCILDIAMPEKKIGIRLNGGYHHVSSRQQTKDEFQKEALKQMGWKIVDFDSYKMPYLFKAKYNDKTVKFVIEEIENEMSDIIG
jgi:very-short-patch-repair endonuclease